MELSRILTVQALCVFSCLVCCFFFFVCFFAVCLSLVLFFLTSFIRTCIGGGLKLFLVKNVSKLVFFLFPFVPNYEMSMGSENKIQSALKNFQPKMDKNHNVTSPLLQVIINF